MQRQGGLAGRFRAVNLDDAAARQAARPRSRLPNFITEPLPNARSIWLSAASRARLRSLFSGLFTTFKATCAIAVSRYFTAPPESQAAV